MELAFWTGKIHIQDASLKHDKINELLRAHHIPLSLSFSFIGGLDIDIPWNRLSSAPVEIQLSNVLLVLRFEAPTSSAAPHQHPKLLLLQNYFAHLMKASEGEAESTFMRRLLGKVMHNINLSVSDIHIRIDHSPTPSPTSASQPHADSNRQDDFSMGFCIQALEANTIDENGEKKFVEVEGERARVRKSIGLRQISVYW